MISFKRKKRASSISKQKSKYYNDLDVPAKIFFDVLETKELSKLIIEGSPKEQQLKDAWDNIFDLYFKERDDVKLRMILKKQANILRFSFLIESAKIYAELLYDNSFTKEQLTEIANALKGLGIRINTEKLLKAQLLKIIKQKIPSWQIRIEREKIDLKELNKGKKASFYEALASLTKAGGITLNQDITLGFYIAYEKQFIKK